ncbi:MAG: MFS transporter [Alphaproteobacteria bacterium]|nr:MFS transporter [Alphaproteobacteria bacterium]
MAKTSSLTRTIIICALGYFIDVFDIQLFAVLRVPSLTEMGVTAERLPVISGYILNAQMLGMITGAFLWGWLGDRFGRLKALYGSILIYSLGTLACSLAQTPLDYGILRFVTGFGLAGETGAAITLIAEMMSPQKRGWGITLVAGIGFLGPVAAVLISWFVEWRTTYVIAGILGLALLILRMNLTEPALFQKISRSLDTRGSLKILMQPKQALLFIYCLLMGLPLMYSWSLLNFFSMEFSKATLAPDQAFNQKLCLLIFYIGTSLGDFISGAISQIWKSRRKTLALLFVIGAVVGLGFLILGPSAQYTTTAFYIIYFILGIVGGGWVLMATVFSEHFGTNIRATTSITLTNLVRGCTIPMLFAFEWLRGIMSITHAAIVIGAVFYALAFLALSQLKETHGLDLDYVEDIKKVRAKA